MAFDYKLRDFFQHNEEHMEIILKDIVSDHWSTVI